MAKDKDSSSKPGSKNSSDKQDAKVKDKHGSKDSKVQKMVVQPKSKDTPATGREQEGMTDEELLAAIRPKHAAESSPPHSKVRHEQTMTSDGSKDSTQAKANGTSSSSSSNLGLILSLIAITLSFFIGAWVYHHGSQFSELEDSLSKIQSRSQRLDGTLTEWQTLQGELQAESNATIIELQEQLQGQSDRMDQLGARQDWKLHEARYLIVLAHERLQAFDDAQTATFLLQSADNRIKSLLDPRTRVVREALAKDITGIQAANRLDIEGLWADLGALSEQLESLEFLSLTDPNKRSSEDASPEVDASAQALNEQTSSWRGALNKSWQEVKSLVKVREFKAEQLNNLLTASEQQQMILTLKLLLEETRWAVLYRNQTVFEKSLQTLDKWLAEYFVQNTDFKNTQFKINSLKAISLKTQWPDLSSSINTVDQLLVSRGLAEPSASQPVTPLPAQTETNPARQRENQEIPQDEQVEMSIEQDQTTRSESQENEVDGLVEPDALSQEQESEQ